jgi:signal transduction histidine kinase/CheY-like chemotaxis protein
LKDALKFRLKLLVAMMLVVVAVTSVTLYLAEKNLRQQNQETLEAQFQNEVHGYLALQEARLAGISEKCRTLSHAVRLRAALEERDVDDLYRNALTELRDVLSTDEGVAEDSAGSVRASFVRFIDPNGRVLPPGEARVGATDQPAIDHALEAMSAALRGADYQSTGFIALTPERQLAALRQVVITKIVDWNGATLGALVLGFPVRALQLGGENATALRAGIFFQRQIFLTGISPFDRVVLSHRINEEIAGGVSGNVEIDLENGPHLVFYKALDPETKLDRAYEVCLFPLAGWLHEAHALRWKIITFGALVLCAGFAASVFLVRGLARPVDQIVAGSMENFTRRQKAEENLHATNRELEKALSELKATQKQIIQQERLSAIGQMASGIAHDFNNTLTPILGFSELLLNNEAVLQNPKQARRFLEMLRTSAQDAASVVSRLREFYRPAEPNAEFPAVDLTRIIRQAISLTEPKWRTQAQANGITIEIVPIFHDAPLVAGEESALREVLTNLIFNAADAMPDGGRITIETVLESGKAVLRVRDTGTGMSEDVRQRCLEPFFSTKGERGTGLGLSMVYGIIERHRGQLEIESELGKGTAFIIRLPCADASAPAAPTVHHAAVPGNLAILVVDDDERVCEVVAEYLRGDGHDVVVVTSGRAAVTQVREKKFDVVFLDRAMPEMSGDQAAELIKQLQPDLPVIMLTGFGALIEVTGSRPRAVDAVLGKPVTLAMLRQTLAKFLHAA